jgi:hypothetical protein
LGGADPEDGRVHDLVEVEKCLARSMERDAAGDGVRLVVRRRQHVYMPRHRSSGGDSDREASRYGDDQEKPFHTFTS